MGQNKTKPSSWQGGDNNYAYEDPEAEETRAKRQAEEEEEEGSEQETMEEDYSFTSEFLTLASELPRDKKLSIGHNLTTMLIACTMNGVKCKPK